MSLFREVWIWPGIAYPTSAFASPFRSDLHSLTRTMASLQALASFLQQQGPYSNFSQIALSINQPTFQSYFDGRDLTLLVPSDDACESFHCAIP